MSLYHLLNKTKFLRLKLFDILIIILVIDSSIYCTCNPECLGLHDRGEEWSLAGHLTLVVSGGGKGDITEKYGPAVRLDFLEEEI